MVARYTTKIRSIQSQSKQGSQRILEKPLKGVVAGRSRFGYRRDLVVMIWYAANHLSTTIHFSNIIACSHFYSHLQNRSPAGLVTRLLRAASIGLVCGICALAHRSSAQQYPENLYQEMRWRMIGPFRGGRT